MSGAEICENIKLAREKALFGNYDTSMVYYQGAVQQIGKLLVMVKDGERRNKWQKVVNLQLAPHPPSITSIVPYANSLDLDETPSNSTSHPDPS